MPAGDNSLVTSATTFPSMKARMVRSQNDSLSVCQVSAAKGAPPEAQYYLFGAVRCFFPFLISPLGLRALSSHFPGSIGFQPECPGGVGVLFDATDVSKQRGKARLLDQHIDGDFTVSPRHLPHNVSGNAFGCHSVPLPGITCRRAFPLPSARTTTSKAPA